MIITIIVTIFVLSFLVVIYIRNKFQKQHSVLRQYPLLGIFRYVFEALGPEMRQYITDTDTEGTPFSRYIYQQVVKLGKYLENIRGFGSQRDFEKPGFYLLNALFCKPDNKLAADNSKSFDTFAYRVQKETLVSRKDERFKTTIKPFALEHPIHVGSQDKLVTKPWVTKSFIGMSSMSYGSLGDHAIQTLAHGLALAGSWINTGEGGICDLHLVGGGDVIYQFGPAMFGCRNPDGSFNSEAYARHMRHPQIVATEVKLHQGAKIKGGILPKEKITERISQIRGIPMGIDCLSPNVYPHINNTEELGRFIHQLKELSGKPVGIKIVMGNWEDVDATIEYLAKNNLLPNFITIDGAEGGSGAAPQDMSDSLGIPTFAGITMLDAILKRHGIRDRIKIFASGKLLTADQIAIAMCLGADCVNIARGLMMQLGCIQALKCNTNKCPVGVATQDPKLQDSLVIEEKMYRVANYIATLRKHTYLLAGACGLSTPQEFKKKHLAHQSSNGIIISGYDWAEKQTRDIDRKHGVFGNQYSHLKC